MPITPKWARDRRRMLRHFERQPMRWILGSSDPGPDSLTPGRLWSVEPMTIATITPPRATRGGVSRSPRRKNQ